MSEITTEIKVMPAPRQVDIAVTGRCNLTCQYCFYADEMTFRGDLAKESWLAFFQELGELGVMTVCLTGGEAFTRPDLFELIDGVIANRMRYSILSNGTLITEKTLEKFEIGKRRQRLNFIQISIDGSSSEVHDSSRPKSFKRALRGLKLLHEAGFPVTVRVTINRYNVNDIKNIAHLLLDEIGIPSFGTNEAYPCGAVDRRSEIMLTTMQRKKVMETLRELTLQFPGRIQATAGPLVLIRELQMMESKMALGETQLPGRGMLSSCGGVFSTLAILHDGTIVPCINLSTLHMGRINEKSLQLAWIKSPVINAVRMRAQVPLSTLETCRDCKYRGFCSGGCPGGALFLKQNLIARNPMDCLRVHKGEIRSSLFQVKLSKLKIKWMNRFA